TVTFTGSRIPVVLATDTMQIAGTIDVSGKGGVGGPGTDQKRTVGRGGSGSCGGDQGGGGGGLASGRGPGGPRPTPVPPLPGGDRYGDEGLSPLRTGAYGGLGGYPTVEVCAIKDGGGGAGGALQLVSCGDLVIMGTAVIDAGGGGGAGGLAPLINNPPGGG